MPPLNVVALISGGKDSFFSILHCQANGHNVVALANLYPSDNEDDLESFMYQTIGHAVIPLYEQALGLPLYRQQIQGGAVNRDKNYGLIDGTPDETESLLPLLQKVVAAHPEVTAVSTGAILSDYQRTRVESIALRLGLTPLSYLWQWPSLSNGTPHSLLTDMAAVLQDSRIIKIASGGLDDSFLWQNVADARTIHRLSRAAERFGTAGDGAVLGEGGEYETLAVSGPAPLWKGHIVVPPDSIQVVPGEAGSASVRIAHPGVVMDEKPTEQALNLRVPPLLEEPFQNMLEKVLLPDLEDRDTSVALPTKSMPKVLMVEDVSLGLRLSNLIGDGADAATQTRAIMEQISRSLGEAKHTFDDIIYTIIILQHMSDFAAVNAIYGSYFPHPNPPARLTIAWADALPADALISISIMSSLGPAQGLHVQSRSYWAPANIGPYSQAIALPNETNVHPSLRGAVYIAGQIPLVPATMELPTTEFSDANERFALQVVLALQHLARIGKVMKVRQWHYGIAFLAKAAHNGVPLTVREDIVTVREDIVRRSWRAFHLPSATATGAASELADEDEEFDIWNVTHGGSTSQAWRVSEADDSVYGDIPKGLPPLTIVEVDALPRNAEVEWVGYGTTTVGDEAAYPLHLQSILDIIEKHSTATIGE